MTTDYYNDLIDEAHKLTTSYHDFLANYNLKKISGWSCENTHNSHYSRDAYYQREDIYLKNIVNTVLKLSKIEDKELRLLPIELLKDATSSLNEMAQHLDKMNRFLSKIRTSNSISKEEHKEKSNLCSKFYEVYNYFMLTMEPFQSRYVEHIANDIQMGITTKEETEKAIKPWGEDYYKSSKNHRDLSIVWIIISLALLLIFIAFTSTSIETTLNDLNEAMNKVKDTKGIELFTLHKQVAIFSISMKLVFSSMLFSILIIMFKNYKINEHHRILNRDKYFATQSVKHLMDAAGTDGNRRLLILDRVTSLLFTNQNSGYIENKNSNAPINLDIPLTKGLKDNE